MRLNRCNCCGVNPPLYSVSVKVYRLGSGRKAGGATSECLPVCADCMQTRNYSGDVTLLVKTVAQRADVRSESRLRCASAG